MLKDDVKDSFPDDKLLEFINNWIFIHDQHLTESESFNDKLKIIIS